MMSAARIEEIVACAMYAARIDIGFMTWGNRGLDAWARVEDYEAIPGREVRKLGRDGTRLSSLRRLLDDPSAALDAPIRRARMKNEIVLGRFDFRLSTELNITEPVHFLYDLSGRWKPHPPSKRKRMRSWLRSSPDVRLRYAPLRGMAEVPARWRHPDEYRRTTLCRFVLWQEIGVFADSVLSAEGVAIPLLMARSDAARAALRAVRL